MLGRPYLFAHKFVVRDGEEHRGYGDEGYQVGPYGTQALAQRQGAGDKPGPSGLLQLEYFRRCPRSWGKDNGGRFLEEDNR